MSENYARIEREGTCDSMLVAGPEASTLCRGWTTRDLAAHLVVRDSRPDAALGIVIPQAAGHGERVREEVARRPWPWLVEDVRSGPPRWFPTRLDAVDRLVNTVEFFIHHEDVRRARDDWSPRELPAGFEAELWGALRRTARFTMRKAPGAVTLVNPAGGELKVASNGPAVRISGRASELTLIASGRQAHARIDVDGPDDAVAAVMSASFGI